MSIDLFALAWKVSFPGKPIKKLVLLSLADQANDRDHHCWPTYETIAKRCGMSRRTAITTIAELEQEGFIRRVARYKAGGLHTSNAFWVNRAAMEVAVASNGETASPQPAPMVNDDHRNGATGSPSMVNDDHHHGDPRSPRTLIDPPSEPQEEPPAAAAPPPAAEPPAPAVAADPRQAVLDWMGFDAILSHDEQRQLDVATLLAWAYTVKLKLAEPRGRVYNPVGLARSLWRHGNPPRADLLRLARGWLLLDDDGRARLLDRLAWASDYAGHTAGDDFERDFPDIPPVLAAAVYTATGGAFGPPSLMPPPAPPPDPRVPQPPANLPAPSPNGHDGNAAQQLWRDALADLEPQMARSTFTQWLAGTTATLDGDELTVHVRNHYAVDWLSSCLHALITRNVTALAGRPIAVRYLAPEKQEAHP